MPETGTIGKAIVFARHDVVVGDTQAWLPSDTQAPIADVPHPGETISAGHPVCTVFAGGRDAETCHAALVQRAEQVYADLEMWAREVA